MRIAAGIIAKEAQENVAPRIFRFAVVTMFVNRNPIDRLAMLVRPIGVALVMLHVDDVVIGLREAARDRLDDSEEPVQKLGAEERVVNEIVRHAVDVGVDHERVNEPEDQHDPERRVRVEKEESEKEREMEETRQQSGRCPSACARTVLNLSSGVRFEWRQRRSWKQGGWENGTLAEK